MSFAKMPSIVENAVTSHANVERAGANEFGRCGWRIVVLPIIPYDSLPCYHSLMHHLVVLFVHFIATLARLLGPGGVRSLVAESLLLKHQLLIVNRSRQRTPNLRSSDRILAGLLALLVRPTRLLRPAIVLKPSTLLAIHKARASKNTACCSHRSAAGSPARKDRAYNSFMRSSK